MGVLSLEATMGVGVEVGNGVRIAALVGKAVFIIAVGVVETREGVWVIAIGAMDGVGKEVFAFVVRVADGGVVSVGGNVASGLGGKGPRMGVPLGTS